MIFLDLFLTFFKIGAFTFGGGYAMLPLIQEEVISHGWMTQDLLVNFIAVSESTPGPFAINMATYVGSQVGGAFGVWGSIFGSFCATLGTVLPSFIVILIVAQFYEKFKSSKTVKGLMSGLKPAAVGLIASAVLTIATTALAPAGWSFGLLTSPDFYASLAIFALGAVLAFKKKHPILIILLSAGLGIIWGYLPV
ncbi:MAG: chromate transporter [Clostridia bacterium]|nr:chromate transporter [Clostridia bacterium]